MENPPSALEFLPDKLNTLSRVLMFAKRTEGKIAAEQQNASSHHAAGQTDHLRPLTRLSQK